MPIDTTQVRQQQGCFQRKHHSLAAPSRDALRRQRFGTPAAPLNVKGVRNQLAVLLLMSTALPAGKQTPLPPRSVAAASYPPVGTLWPPGARAMETAIEMSSAAAGPTVSTADSPLLHSGLEVVNAATDTAVATCLRTPRHCATALTTAATVATFWAGATAAGYLLNLATARSGATGSMPAQPPETMRYTLDPTRLLEPLRFNASELDPASSPCESLGAHVNHRWEEASALQLSRTQFGTLDHLRSNALLQCQQLAEQMARQTDPDAPEKVIGDLWAMGMDEARIEVAGRRPLQPTLDAIDALSNRDALLAYLFNASSRAMNPLFELSVLPDQIEPTKNKAYLAQSGLGLPDSTWYDDPAKQDKVDAYRSHVAHTLVLSGVPSDDAERLSSDIITFERALAAASVPFAVYAADPSVYHNLVDADEARQQTPNIDWRSFFAAQGISTPATFSLGMPGFFRCVDTQLDITALDVWKAYLRFHATDAAAPCLSSAFVDRHDAYHGGVMKGRRSRVPRFARVMGIIQEHAGDALGPAYARVAFPAATRRGVEAMTGQMTAALRRRLHTCEWMDDASRTRALEKVDTLRIDLGHPEKWPPWGHVGTGRSSFLENVQAVRAHAQRRNIVQLDKRVDETHWKLTPQTVDAYQDVQLNRIVIPAALLQPPLFDPAADEALNYGGIGAIIGHEMAHGFDATGTQFNARGEEVDWLTPASRLAFKARAEQLRMQYTQFVADGQEVDGKLTLDENLADIGGLAIAMDAMRHVTAGIPDPMIDGMTREQRLFANYALVCRTLSTPERAELQRSTDNHAPANVRADAAPSNHPDFARVFNCTEGAPMAPASGDQVRFL